MMGAPMNRMSGKEAVRRPQADAGTGPGWQHPLGAIRGRLVRLNRRLEDSLLGNVLATVFFAIWVYALFFIGGILQ